VHPVGSYCANISRCTVHKILKKYWQLYSWHTEKYNIFMMNIIWYTTRQICKETSNSSGCLTARIHRSAVGQCRRPCLGIFYKQSRRAGKHGKTTWVVGAVYKNFSLKKTLYIYIYITKYFKETLACPFFCVLFDRTFNYLHYIASTGGNLSTWVVRIWKKQVSA
jgi:hypothetical protein